MVMRMIGSTSDVYVYRGVVVDWLLVALIIEVGFFRIRFSKVFAGCFPEEVGVSQKRFVTHLVENL